MTLTFLRRAPPHINREIRRHVVVGLPAACIRNGDAVSMCARAIDCHRVRMRARACRCAARVMCVRARVRVRDCVSMIPRARRCAANSMSMCASCRRTCRVTVCAAVVDGDSVRMIPA